LELLNNYLGYIGHRIRRPFETPEKQRIQAGIIHNKSSGARYSAIMWYFCNSRKIRELINKTEINKWYKTRPRGLAKACAYRRLVP
jgi:hypothetical protein